MALIIRMIILLLGMVLILYSGMDILSGQRVNRTNLSALVFGLFLLFISIFNGGRRLFADPNDSLEADSVELFHDLTWRNVWTYMTMHFGIFRAFSKSGQKNPSTQARQERVDAAKRKAAALSQTSQPQGNKGREEAEPITDYWKLPKSGRRTTLLNSAWTWMLIVYVIILAVVGFSVAQNGLTFIDQQSNTARIAIAAGLIYPAWRIGSLISRFMKKRGIGAGFSILGETGAASKEASSKPTRAKKTARPGSVEARMEERRARLEKARAEGKI